MVVWDLKLKFDGSFSILYVNRIRIRSFIINFFPLGSALGINLRNM